MPEISKVENIVYLIEDEIEMLELLTEAVELSGLKPFGFSSAQRFFSVFNDSARYSILILDLHMPDMDGIEVMRRLAKVINPPSLILISGHDSSILHSAEKLGNAHNLDIIASMQKPIVLNELLTLLKSHVPKLDTYLASNAHYQFSELELHQAIWQDQLVLHYQPQFRIKDKKLVGAEALVRWNHPEQGLVSPDQFIPLAESSGLMKDLTQWVIDNAVSQEQTWNKLGYKLPVSVNISAVDITSLTLPEQLSRLLNTRKLNPTHLTLEITESTLMGELVTSLDILTRLRLKGFKLSIDDFGTGYSSLSQLHKVPFTELKIDHSFVSSILDDDDALAIVKTCIMLGHELKMQVVAEGVENEQQFKLLKKMGCDLAQGFWLSKPVTATQLIKNTSRLA